MRIAIIRRNGLGDLLSVMPLVTLCKEKFSGCHITLFIDSRAAPLLPYLEGVDQAVIFPSDSNKYRGLLRTAWGEREKRFDLAISARPTPMKLLNLFLFLLRARKRIAYVDEAWHSCLINQPKGYNSEDKRHQMVKSLRLLDPVLESVPLRLRPRLRVKPSFKFQKKTLMVSVTNNRVGSRLDLDKTERILNRAFDKMEFGVVINCEPNNEKKAQALAGKLNMQTDVIATSAFEQFLGLIAAVDGLLIGDGGIMHLAAALNKPQVVLFGGTELWEWHPLSDQAICLRDEHNVNFIPEEEIQTAVESFFS